MLQNLNLQISLPAFFSFDHMQQIAFYILIQKQKTRTHQYYQWNTNKN